MKISTFSTFKKEWFPRKLFTEIRYLKIVRQMYVRIFGVFVNTVKSNVLCWVHHFIKIPSFALLLAFLNSKDRVFKPMIIALLLFSSSH